MHYRVLITGASGKVAYNFLFRLASGEVFGPDVNLTLQLYDLPATMAKLQAISMELEDCAYPLVQAVICTSDIATAAKEVSWAFLIGAMPRVVGMERADLLKNNSAIFKEQGIAINEQANNDVKILVVGNPCNSNCWITKHFAPDIPKTSFFALTTLDENRAKFQLASKAGVNVAAVKNVTIWGNHSALQFPDFYHATINGKPAVDVIADADWLQHTFLQLVRTRGAEIIKVGGTSSVASAANAIVNCAQNLSRNTPANEWFSLCCYANGEYDVEPGLMFSYPCCNNNGVISIVTDIELNDFTQQQLLLNITELRHEKAEIMQLLGVK